MKKIVFFLFFISLYNCQPKIEKIRYETSMGIPVEKSIAKNYLDVYKKVFLLDNEIQKIEYRLGNDSTKLIMLLDYRKNTNKAKVIEEYPQFSQKNFFDRFITINKKNISGYSFQIFNESLADYLSHYLYSDNGWILGCEEFGSQKNGNIVDYPSGRKFAEKYLYNAQYASILTCNYESDIIKVYKPESFLFNNKKPVETFTIKEFDKMKEKYFPYDDISYYSSREIEPTKKQVSELKKFLTQNNHKDIEYHTEIGTLTDEKKIKTLEKYSKCFYTKGILVKEEFYSENSLESIDYYYEDNFFEKVSTPSYRKIKREKKGANTIEYQTSYNKNQIINQTNIIRDSRQRIIAIEYLKDGIPNYRATKKFYYNDKGIISAVFIYGEAGDLRRAELWNNEMLFIKPKVINADQQSKIGLNFYGIDMNYYMSATL